MTSRGVRNNNPGNIRRSPIRYKGEREQSTDTAFKQFESIEWGYRAMFVLLTTYAVKYGLHTIRQIINRYAPPVENNTEAYIDTVAALAGKTADQPLDCHKRDDMVPVVAAMSRVENGRAAIMTDVERGWELYCNR